MCVPAPLTWPRSPLPELPTPGGGEMIGVPFCRMGLDVCPCCRLLVCVLDWVAEEVPLTSVDAVCTVEVRLEAPLLGGLPDEGRPSARTLFCPARGMGGRSGVSCRDWAAAPPTASAVPAVGADGGWDAEGRGVFCHAVFVPGGTEVRREPWPAVRCAFAPLPGTGCWAGPCPETVCVC